MSSSSSIQDLNERLNDLYWTSESTIDEILGRVGVTRNRLYEAVRPLPAGESCVRCAGDLIYPNRRSRLASTALCSGCGREAIVEAIIVEITPGNGGQDGDPTRAIGRLERGWGSSDRKRALIGGAAALGVMVGAAATRVINN